MTANTTLHIDRAALPDPAELPYLTGWVQQFANTAAMVESD